MMDDASRTRNDALATGHVTPRVGKATK